MRICRVPRIAVLAAASGLCASAAEKLVAASALDFAAEVTQDVAAALRTLDTALRRLRPVRRTGTWGRDTYQILQRKHDITTSEFWLWANMRVLAVEQGGIHSNMLSGDGRPIPMYTYPMIEWLDQHDLSDVSVLEFGSGFSSLYYAGHASQVVSLESDTEWSQYIRDTARDAGQTNIDIVDVGVGGGAIKNAASWTANPAAALDATPWKRRAFDIVVIDCAWNRHMMVDEAAKRLSPAGIIILDNTEHYPKAAQSLREDHGMMQVDFHGLKPQHFEGQVTSVFFSAGARQPHGVNGTDVWSRRLHVGKSRQAAAGTTETEWLYTDTPHLSRLPAGYAVGGNIQNNVWDQSASDAAKGPRAGQVIGGERPPQKKKKKKRKAQEL